MQPVSTQPDPTLVTAGKDTLGMEKPLAPRHVILVVEIMENVLVNRIIYVNVRLDGLVRLVTPGVIVMVTVLVTWVWASVTFATTIPWVTTVKCVQRATF